MSDERRTLLVEIGTEDLPTDAQAGLAEALRDEIAAGLEKARVEHDQCGLRWFATPRRLAVQVPGVAERQPDVTSQRLGPYLDVAYRDGQPTKAAEGFARSVGAGVDELDEIEDKKGKRLAFEIEEKGRSTVELVPRVVENALRALPLPRRMRWGSGDDAFIRPIQWIVLMLGTEVIEATLFGVRSGGATFGHRFHHPDPVRLGNAGDYEKALKQAKVVADFGSRRERVREQVTALADSVQGEAWLDEDLLDEVTALTEWPVAIAGDFDEEFLTLPPEVISTTLVHHQSFFPVVDGQGDPTTHFIGVANIESRDPETVRQGYERVVRPRLGDAAFFYRQDQRTPLADRREQLDGMQFQKRLGSIMDKSRRIAELAGGIAARLDEDGSQARRAADLCKCDLTTLMVGEFPELQGLMGGYYARLAGEPEPVCEAIAGHYRPRFAGDGLPAGAAGQAVALADKLDTVCGIIATGGRPTGNKDPFALRRAAVGVLRILIETGRPLDLRELIDDACGVLAENTGVEAGGEQRDEMLGFFLDRFRAWCRDRGVRPDIIEAVIASGSSQPFDLHRRVQAVDHFISLPEAASLASASKRIRNILKQADGEIADEADASIMEREEESALHRAVSDKREAVEPRITSGDYQAALVELSRLREPVDAFFDNVMVMAEDEAQRNNRLALLAGLNGMFDRIADISRLDFGGDQR